MAGIDIRYMQFIFRNKIVFPLFLAMILVPGLAPAQFNAYQFDYKHESKFAHFGILMGFNKSDFRIRKSNYLLYNDSLRVVESNRGPGFNLGIVSNVHLGKNFDLRFLPSMVFAEKSLSYETYMDTTFHQGIESILLEFPLLLKFKSNPYKDMRFYIMGGIKYSFDLASNALARNADNIVKVGKHDFSIEYGFGFEIYFPYFILAPELRISQGIMDVHSPDSRLNFSKAIDRLFTRGFAIVINIEG